MDPLGLEGNSGGDSTLYTRWHTGACPDSCGVLLWPPVTNGESPQGEPHGIFLAAEPQPAALFEPLPAGNHLISGQRQQGQPLYTNSFYQSTLALTPVAELEGNGFDSELLGVFSAEPQHASLFELPQVGNQYTLGQGQQIHPLYASFYQPALAWPPVAEPQESINAENPQAEPSRELEPQPHNPPHPVIHSNAADRSGSRPGQEFRCNNKCRGVFAGPHKCSYHGRSLTISCRGGDENCPSEFLRRNDFNRHCETVHHSTRAGALVKKLLDCTFPGCDRVGEKGFKRKNNLTQHRRNVHEEKIMKNPIRFGRSNGV